MESPIWKPVRIVLSTALIAAERGKDGQPVPQRARPGRRQNR